MFHVKVLDYDTAVVTSMSAMFQGESDFDGDISSWNTASVTDISYMFGGGSKFNDNISG